MYSALQIANQFIETGVKESNLLTHLKLQKVLYLANGFFIAKHNIPLITEQFKAWKLGPVIPSVYYNFKDFGGNPIDRLATGISFKELSQDALADIDTAWNIGKNIDAITLSNWTHAPESPWKKAVDRQGEYILNEDLIEYFSRVFNLQRIEE